MILRRDSKFHLMSPIAGCQPTSGQLRAAAFQSSRPGQATNMWTQPLHNLLKSHTVFPGQWPQAKTHTFHFLRLEGKHSFNGSFPDCVVFCLFHLLAFSPPSLAQLCSRSSLLPSFLATISCLAFLRPPHHSGFPLLLGLWSGFL